MRAARSAARTAVLAGVLALPRLAGAQTDVRIDLPPDNPFPAAPQVFVHALNMPDSTAPRQIRLRLALDQGLGLVVFDSTITGDDARFNMIKLLPENRDIFADVRVFDKNGLLIRTVLTKAGHTGPRLQLVAPSGNSGVSLPSRLVQFAWRSAPLTFPPGPWIYELFITDVAAQVTRSVPNIADTVFTYPDTLQGDTPYRWKVVARLPFGIAADSAVAASQSSFVVTPPGEAVATLLYQNFPNPFPALSSATTCVWFDLHTPAHVDLTILDLRGHRVRTLVPGTMPADLPAGRYGRRGQFDTGGCDPRLAWDGTADDGRIVPGGVYLLRFKANNGAPEFIKKIVFLGH